VYIRELSSSAVRDVCALHKKALLDQRGIDGCLQDRQELMMPVMRAGLSLGCDSGQETPVSLAPSRRDADMVVRALRVSLSRCGAGVRSVRKAAMVMRSCPVATHAHVCRL